MAKEGRLVILATSASADMFPSTTLEEQSVVEADENPFVVDCTIVPDAYMYADCRMTQSKRNGVFVRWVSEALHEGRDIVLVAPRADMLDKRLRERAITFSLPERKNESSLS